MRKIFILILCLIIVLITGTGYSEVSNRVEAVVNDELITLYELNKRIEELTGQRPDDIRALNEEQFIETRRSILESMINEKIALEKARELGLEATESEIDSYIENIKTANQWTQEDLVSQLKGEGLAYEVFRKRIKEDMVRNSLMNYEVQGKTIVREDQIIEYYQEHKDDFKIEGQVDIASIFLMKSGTDPAGTAFLKRLEHPRLEVFPHQASLEKLAGRWINQLSQVVFHRDSYSSSSAMRKMCVAARLSFGFPLFSAMCLSRFTSRISRF